MQLSGVWRAAEADEALRRAYPDPVFDDSHWQALVVPSHWRSTPAFESSDGPLLARTTFEHRRLSDQERGWLWLDGVFYQSDVWLDGGYVGDTEGYFAPHVFDVSPALRDRREHTLAIEVTCAPQRDRTAKRNLTGVFQHWDCLDPDWNPGGIWRPVHVRTTGPAAILRLRALCLEATPERALLSFRAVVDTTQSGEATLRTSVSAGRAANGDDPEQGHEHVEVRNLAYGVNEVEWRMAIEHPVLWWPRALGRPDLVDVSVTVAVAGEESDHRRLRTGLRQIRLKNWVASINGERLFLKGANQGPVRMALGEATAADFDTVVTMALDANLDLLRVHGHISRPELYEAADRHGLLLWQDLPLQWGYARTVRKQAVKQARLAVDTLGHHPSIALWCAHNEPLPVDVEPGQGIDMTRVVRNGATTLLLPTYNKTVLDGSLHRALHKADASRPVIPSSGILGRTDAHLYFGWYHGNERDLPTFAAAWPRAVRFVGQFGAQAVPSTDDFIEAERWPDLDWERLARTHSLQRTFFARNGLEPTDYPTFAAWRDATQRYQADLLKHHVETLRRLKYRPAGGFAQFSFADGFPGVTWSVVDAGGVAKAGLAALTEACAPVIVVADRLAPAYVAGDPIALDVHVVSDEREPIADAVATACLQWAGGEHRWRWTGTIGPDAVVRVGTIQAVAPADAGPLTLTLGLEAAANGLSVTNSYESVITAG